MGNGQSAGGGPQGESGAHRCYYAVVGVAPDATADEVRRAYRKQALLLHPDKNVQAPGAASHDAFAALQAAYEVLSDPQERAWYDRNREGLLRRATRAVAADAPTVDDLMPFFDAACYPQRFTDGPQGFFTTYRNLFAYIDRCEEDEALARRRWQQRQAGGSFNGSFSGSFSAPPPTTFGSKATPYEPTVAAFYARWRAFTTVCAFEEEGAAPYERHASRYARRAVSREAARAAEARARHYSQTVRDLVAFVCRRDPRWKAQQAARAAERSAAAARAAEAARARRLTEAAAYIEPSWSATPAEAIARLSLQLPSSGEESNDDSDGDIYCGVCRKYFRNKAQWLNHAASKRHRSALLALGIVADGHGLNDCDDCSHHRDTSDDADRDTGIEADESADEEGSGADRAKGEDSTEAKVEDSTEAKGEGRQKVAKNKSAMRREKRAIASASSSKAGSRAGESTSSKTDKETTNRADQGVRRERKKRDEAAARCNACGAPFESRNALFAHLKATGHQAAQRP